MWRYDPISRNFVGAAAMGLSAQLVRSLRFPMESCFPIVVQAVNEGRVMRSDPPGSGPLIDTIYAALGEPTREALVVPLLSRGKDRCWRVRRIADGCAKAEDATLCGEWIMHACEQQGVPFHQGLLTKLANVGLLTKDDPSRRGHRRYYRLKDVELVKDVLGLAGAMQHI